MLTKADAANAAGVEGEAADLRWMRKAFAAACAASAMGEVPVGACIVDRHGALLAVAANRTRADCDPTAHAEIVALRSAARTAGNYRLIGAVVYSTIEPCAMCAGALVQARIRRLVYGAPDERFGAVQSQFSLLDSGAVNHRIDVTCGVLEQDCRILMQQFFRSRR